MRQQYVCTTTCGNTGCTFNQVHNSLPEDKTPWQATRYTKYCGGWIKPKTTAKKTKENKQKHQ